MLSQSHLLPQIHLVLQSNQSLLFAVCSRLRMQSHRTTSNNSLLQWSVTVHLSSCGVCLGDSGVSVPHFVAEFSSKLGFSGWFFPGIFPLGIQKVQRIANLVVLEKC